MADAASDDPNLMYQFYFELASGRVELSARQVQLNIQVVLPSGEHRRNLWWSLERTGAY